MNLTRLIDLSSAGQGGLPLGVLQAERAKGVLGAYVRCGYGNNGADADFASNARATHDAGMYAGAYHVVFPLDHIDPVKQAEEHFEACGGLGSGGGELPPAVDLEWPVPGSVGWAQYKCTPLSVRTWALACLARMTELYRKTPVLYVGYPDYWRAIGGASEQGFAAYRLWAVDYPLAYQTITPPNDDLLITFGPWARTGWSLWQYTNKTHLSNGMPVDSSVFNGDADALRAFCEAGS